MNASEGVRRLGAVIRWIGDGLGVVCLIVGMVLANSASGNQLAILAGALLVGAFFSGSGRAISWIIQGFAKND